MAGYMIVVRVGHLSTTARRRAGRKIKDELRRHPGLVRRTGVLSRSSFVRIDDGAKLMYCGATAPYASYLSQGKGYLKHSYTYISDAVQTHIGKKYIQTSKLI